MANGAKSSPKRIEATARAAEAVRLRIQGLSFDAIAERVGYKSRQAAFDAVKRALEAILREPSDELRELDLRRLDELLLGQWPAAQSGDPDAVDCCLRILSKRWRLLGLDQPRPQEQAAPPQTVMVVPYMSASEWEAVAAPAQARLKEAVRL
jgi:hypothetical protein